MPTCQALKRRGCAFLVAPYEADAQMAYLALNGLVDVVLTEDSDLLCYGCPKACRRRGQWRGCSRSSSKALRQALLLFKGRTDSQPNLLPCFPCHR